MTRKREPKDWLKDELKFSKTCYKSIPRKKSWVYGRGVRSGNTNKIKQAAAAMEMTEEEFLKLAKMD